MEERSRFRLVDQEKAGEESLVNSASWNRVANGRRCRPAEEAGERVGKPLDPATARRVLDIAFRVVELRQGRDEVLVILRTGEHGPELGRDEEDLSALAILHGRAVGIAERMSLLVEKGDVARSHLLREKLEDGLTRDLVAEDGDVLPDRDIYVREVVLHPSKTRTGEVDRRGLLRGARGAHEDEEEVRVQVILAPAQPRLPFQRGGEGHEGAPRGEGHGDLLPAQREDEVRDESRAGQVPIKRVRRPERFSVIRKRLRYVQGLSLLSLLQDEEVAVKLSCVALRFPPRVVDAFQHANPPIPEKRSM